MDDLTFSRRHVKPLNFQNASHIRLNNCVLYYIKLKHVMVCHGYQDQGAFKVYYFRRGVDHGC